jgi:allantoinase
MYDLLIRNGTVITPDGVRPADVAVEHGRVVEVAAGLAGAGREEIDATGLHVFPGLIDVHVHFNEPGRADWEGVATGSAALAAGGGTCFFDMPLNSTPPVIDGARFDEKVAAMSGSSYADFALWGGLVPGNLGRMAELADRGVIGFKAFMSNSGIDDFGRADDLTLLRGMKEAARLGLPVAVHAESEELTGRLTAEARGAGKTSVRDYLDTRPIVAEVDAIRRAVLFAAEAGCKLHVVHVSSAAGMAAVTAGGGTVTGETCAHYLALSDVDVEAMGARAKCAPPLRSSAEVAKLWDEVAEGRVTLVSSDHSPAPASMKTAADFFAIWGGIAGVQSTRAVLLTHEPRLPLPVVSRLTAGAPADRFGVVGKGRVEPTYDADLSLVDLGVTVELRVEDLLDRHKLSPYVGRTFRGRVVRTILRGQTMYQDGKIVGKPIGRLLKPAKD